MFDDIPLTQNYPDADYYEYERSAARAASGSDRDFQDVAVPPELASERNNPSSSSGTSTSASDAFAFPETQCYADDSGTHFPENGGLSTETRSPSSPSWLIATQSYHEPLCDKFVQPARTPPQSPRAKAAFLGRPETHSLHVALSPPATQVYSDLNDVYSSPKPRVRDHPETHSPFGELSPLATQAYPEAPLDVLFSPAATAFSSSLPPVPTFSSSHGSSISRIHSEMAPPSSASAFSETLFYPEPSVDELGPSSKLNPVRVSVDERPILSHACSPTEGNSRVAIEADFSSDASSPCATQVYPEFLFDDLHHATGQNSAGGPIDEKPCLRSVPSVPKFSSSDVRNTSDAEVCSSESSLPATQMYPEPLADELQPAGRQGPVAVSVDERPRLSSFPPVPKFSCSDAIITTEAEFSSGVSSPPATQLYSDPPLDDMPPVAESALSSQGRSLSKIHLETEPSASALSDTLFYPEPPSTASAFSETLFYPEPSVDELGPSSKLNLSPETKFSSSHACSPIEGNSRVATEADFSSDASSPCATQVYPDFLFDDLHHATGQNSAGGPIDEKPCLRSVPPVPKFSSSDACASAEENSGKCRQADLPLEASSTQFYPEHALDEFLPAAVSRKGSPLGKEAFCEGQSSMTPFMGESPRKLPAVPSFLPSSRASLPFPAKAPFGNTPSHGNENQGLATLTSPPRKWPEMRHASKDVIAGEACVSTCINAEPLSHGLSGQHSGEEIFPETQAYEDFCSPSRPVMAPNSSCVPAVSPSTALPTGTLSNSPCLRTGLSRRVWASVGDRTPKTSARRTLTPADLCPVIDIGSDDDTEGNGINGSGSSNLGVKSIGKWDASHNAPSHRPDVKSAEEKMQLVTPPRLAPQVASVSFERARQSFKRRSSEMASEDRGVPQPRGAVGSETLSLDVTTVFPSKRWRLRGKQSPGDAVIVL
eukprot:TRINITY_DN4567_c0_g1_i3.p1 TRINITY_DN4567_c0_g1~~TRINITY_DN4567_c0_g1_i3.p1  ORF type:complete len:941 (-),score=96.68 TRINITY_DN4567_c0_g1_i3:206-3028(-)